MTCGVVCLMVGVFMVAGFFFGYDISAPSNNAMVSLQNLSTRECGVLIGLGIIIFGMLSLVINALNLIAARAREIPEKIRENEEAALAAAAEAKRRQSVSPSRLQEIVQKANKP